MIRWSVLGEEPGQGLEHVVRAQASGDHDGQALPAVLINHSEHPDRAPVVCPVGYEVVRPDVVPVERPQPDARAVVEPDPCPFRLSARDFQPLLAPDPFHPLVIHRPSLGSQHPRDHPVAVTPEPLRKADHVAPERFLIRPCDGRPALCRAGLSQHPARPPLTHPEPLLHMDRAASAPLGAQKFPFDASFRIRLSSVRSDTARRSR